MEDQSRFLEMLEEIKMIAHSQQGKLTQEEVKQYLSDMELSEEQIRAVFQYLGANDIQIEGYLYIPSEKEKEEAAARNEKTAENKKNNAMEEADTEAAVTDRAEQNRRIYQQELTELKRSMSDDKEECITRFLQGEDTFRNRIVEKYLELVMERAVKYKNRSVLLEEVIAEGNLGLLTGMEVIAGNRGRYLGEGGRPDMDAFVETLDREITQAMESYIDGMTEEKDWESTVLARTNLLHEAAKYMTEEIGRVPTREELSEYTKISLTEIEQIMGLSEDARRVAEPS